MVAHWSPFCHHHIPTIITIINISPILYPVAHTRDTNEEYQSNPITICMPPSWFVMKQEIQQHNPASFLGTLQSHGTLQLHATSCTDQYYPDQNIRIRVTFSKHWMTPDLRQRAHRKGRVRCRSRGSATATPTFSVTRRLRHLRQICWPQEVYLCNTTMQCTPWWPPQYVHRSPRERSEVNFVYCCTLA